MAASRPANGPPSQPSISRRDNNPSSLSGSRSERSTRARGPQPAVESAVTRLLVSIKALLEALTLWSTLQKTEFEVSDVYVRLGNDFNQAVQAFSVYEIDMSELLAVPDDLRTVLEDCLSEEASPKNLDKFLPTVRQIITGLLTGLRGKQSLYRQVVSQQRQSQRSSGTAHERTESRSSRSERGPRRPTEDGSAPRQRNAPGEGSSRRDTASSRSSRQTHSSRTFSPSRTGDGTDDPPFVGGFAPPSAPDRVKSPVTETQSPSSAMRQQSVRMDTVQNQIASPVDTSDAASQSPFATSDSPLPESESEAPAIQQAPAGMTRFSLVDKPALPAVIVDTPSGELTPPPETPASLPDTTQTPAMASSLAALERSDILQRRASKRFSTYNISKMTGGSVRGGNANNRRSMAASNALTIGELAVLAEADDESPATPPREMSRSRSPRPPNEETPPVPPLPPTPAKELGKAPGVPAKPNGVVDHTATPKPAMSVESMGSSMTVFLQVGREVKKVPLERDYCSLSSLRMLFLDKFSYTPGKGNFPAIYIRDPSSGVQYELEDMEEVKDGCLLSLNIEPLDQIKQHIDLQIGTLAQDIKELKNTVASRQLPQPAPIMTQPFETSTPARPSDRQLVHAARRLSRIVGDDSQAPEHSSIAPQSTGQTLVPQMTGMSVMSEHTARVVSDLRTQFDEVQNLRRDLGIMRQLYTEFMKQTKESLGTLREKTQGVRMLATTEVSGARAYIDSGKANLDQRSQTVLTRMEELQDLVEVVKDDVLKKNIKPKPNVLKNIKDDVANVAAELQSLETYIGTVKPMWKKTWEEELQNIVEEQQFLHHQEEFLGDLREDHKATLEVWSKVERVISLRGTNSGRKSRGYRPPPPEEGHGGLTSVMMEIRGAAVDPEKRMKAIAANQKNREKDLAMRSDEFQEELTGFVQGKKLKMTGGAEEAERVRQKRNDMALKAMFTGNSGTPTGSTPGSPGKESSESPVTAET